MMDNDKAKQILEAIHLGQAAGGADCDAACALLEGDAGLQEWFAASTAEGSDFDRAVASKLAAIAAPEGAEDAARSVARGGRGGNPIVRLLVPLAAAAALVFAGLAMFDRGDGGGGDPAVGPVVLAQHSGGTLDAFRGDMAEFAINRLELQHEAVDLPELKSWLGANDAPVGANLSRGIADAEAMGCAVVGWGEARVSMICFNLADAGVVHLFVIDRSLIESGDIEASLAQKVERDGLETAGWADGDKVYLLVGATADVHLDGLL